MIKSGLEMSTETTTTMPDELNVTLELIDALVRESYEWAFGHLFISGRQSVMPSDNKAWMERRALSIACLNAGSRWDAYNDDLLAAIEESVAGIAANPVTWIILDRAPCRPDPAKWYRRLKPVRLHDSTRRPVTAGKVS
jgi:hypothetical protein